MKHSFDDVVFEWAGKEYRIPANRVLGAIARVEDIITMPDLGDRAKRGTPPLSKVAQAYGAVLRYAGARVTDEEVYCDMFTHADVTGAVMTTINSLFYIMLPPAAKAQFAAIEHMEPDEESPQGNPLAAAPAS